MKKYSLWFLVPCLLLLSGCASGTKSATLSTVYGVMAVLSLLLLLAYLALMKQRQTWFIVLYSCVLIVNIGYFLLSLSQSLSFALWANRVAYLGSVFLPLSMLMIVLRVSGLKHRPWLPITLLAVAGIVFLIAASPGVLDIYYREVSLQWDNGVAVLHKVYGPAHMLYPVYLIGYFLAIIAAMIHAYTARQVTSPVQGMILTAAVFINILVWLLEQLVHLDFELLSVSYIVTELFLLGLYMMLQEVRKEPAAAPAAPTAYIPDQEQLELFRQGLKQLTNTERNVYRLYLQGLGTQDVLQTLHIKENTLKYHNKNIYSKLGVSSRKQLLQIARYLQEQP